MKNKINAELHAVIMFVTWLVTVIAMAALLAAVAYIMWLLGLWA